MAAYLERIYQHFKLNDNILIVGLVLFDKVINKNALDLK
jgi:hypothetical protein